MRLGTISPKTMAKAVTTMTVVVKAISLRTAVGSAAPTSSQSGSSAGPISSTSGPWVPLLPTTRHSARSRCGAAACTWATTTEWSGWQIESITVSWCSVDDLAQIIADAIAAPPIRKRVIFRYDPNLPHCCGLCE